MRGPPTLLDDLDGPRDVVERWYHVPVLAFVMAFMVWVRLQSYDRFVGGDGEVALAAVDSWYHWRSTLYTVENWPSTIDYEVWTGYPTGTYVGQFGTLFDQLVATAALVAGLGSPTEDLIFRTALVAVPVMAALVAIPVFMLGRRLGGRLGGLTAVGILALSPGAFLSRSTVGMFQHHVAEVLFMTIAVLAMLVALRSAVREQVLYEHVVDRDRATLRWPTIYAVLAGIAVSLYVWTWPPGVVLIGIFGVYFVVQVVLDHLRDVTPEPIVFTGATSLAVTAVLTATTIEIWSPSPTALGYLPPTLAALVAAGCLVLGALHRWFSRRGVRRRWYPITVGVGIGIGAVAVAFLLPDIFGVVVRNLGGRLLPFGHEASGLTIVEAQPPDAPWDQVVHEYGLGFYGALLAIPLLAYELLFEGKRRVEVVFVVVWFGFLTSMALTQVRFFYYLVVAVAVMDAYLVGLVATSLGLADSESPLAVEGFHVVGVLAVLLLLLGPLLLPMTGATAVDVGAAAGPSQDAIVWSESNEWLATNTPAEGEWGTAEGTLDYYGTHEIPTDRDFAYPDGTYGVLTWWDYGHLLTVQAERIPHSNPFQQHARSSSAFLVSGSEERAELVLDAIATGAEPADHSDEELAAVVAESGREGGTDEPIRYVMTEDQMVGGKFSAIATWTGPGASTYFTGGPVTVRGQTYQVTRRSDRYWNTTMARLHFDDAAGMEHYRLVHEADQFSIVGGFVDLNAGSVRPVSTNRLYRGWTDSIGGGMTVADLHRQAAEARSTDRGLPMGGGQFAYDPYVTAAVKTFERVDGALLTGTAPDEATAVVVRLPLEVENTGRRFAYTQTVPTESDGGFAVRVPYATTDYLDTDDGYTDTEVRARGDYAVLATDRPAAVRSGSANPNASVTTAVSDRATVEGDEIAVDLRG